MKKTIYRSFDYTECDDFAVFLNHMAMQGWHFKEWKLGLVFEKGKPQETEYSVEVIPENKKDQDKTTTRLLQDEKEFAEYCAFAGWLLLAKKDNIYIFKKLKEDAVPVLEAEERLKNIVKVERKERTIWTVIFGLLFLMRMYCFWNNPEVWLFQEGMFWSTIILLMGCVFDISYLISMFIWKQNKIKKLENGKEIYFGKKENLFLITSKTQLLGKGVCEILITLIFLYHRQYQAAVTIPLLFGVDLTMRILEEISKVRFQWKREDKRYECYRAFRCALVFLLIQILDVSLISPMDMQEERVLMKEECPLVREDYMEVEGEFEKAGYLQVSSRAGTIKRYDITYQDVKSSIYPRNGSDILSYMIYESENDWVLDCVYNYLEKHLYGEPQDQTEAWGAEEAASGENYLYIVKYQDKVVRFGDTADLTQEEIQIIRDRLDLR